MDQNKPKARGTRRYDFLDASASEEIARRVSALTVIQTPEEAEQTVKRTAALLNPAPAVKRRKGSNR
ncbi:MAG: hypothetical protein E6R08_09020 [Nevskiaceae bacterium]|nr:MAG: hypothetical protein E6R08_09020 [Nevskiaceae bacterium]